MHLSTFMCKIFLVRFSVSEKHRILPMAKAKCLVGDLTNLYSIYKAHQTNVWWSMKVFRLHWRFQKVPLKVHTKYLAHRLRDMIFTYWNFNSMRPSDMSDTYMCQLSNFTGSNNGLLSGWHQAIILTNAGILLIGPLGMNFNEILIETRTFSFKKMHLKLVSVKWRLFSLGLSVLRAVIFELLRIFEIPPCSCWIPSCSV